MGIGVEIAVDQHLFSVEVDESAHDRFEGDPQCAEVGFVVEAVSFQKGHDDRIFAAVFGVGHGEGDTALGIGAGELLQVFQLYGKVDLLYDHGSELFDHRFDGVARVVGEEGTKEAVEKAEDADVCVDTCTDSVTAQFDRHFGTVGEGSGMDLSDRGAGDRGFVEASERVMRSEGALPYSVKFRFGHGRDLVVQALERFEIGSFEKVSAGGEDLCEFDEAGTQIVDGRFERLG